MITQRIKFKKMLPTKQRNQLWDSGKVLSEETNPDGSLSIVCGWDNLADMLAWFVHFGAIEEVK